MNGMKEMRDSRRAVGTLAVVLVAAAVVAGGSAGAYYLLSDSGDSDSPLSGVYSEDVLKGAYGLNSVFTYDIVDSDGIPIDQGDDIRVVISGESGSYYFMEIQENDEHPEDWDTVEMVMVHKTNGEVRFASNMGDESIEYDGIAKDVTRWRSESLLSAMELWTDQDSVIYKMYVGPDMDIFDMFDPDDVLDSEGTDGNDEAFAAVLTGIEATAPGDYVKPDAVGEMARVSVTVTDDTASKVILGGTMDVVCIATVPDGDGYDSIYLVRTAMNGSYAGVTGSASICEYVRSDNEIRLADVFERIRNDVTTDEDLVKGDAVNVNGVMCDVYTDEGEDGILKVYLGATDGITYKVEAVRNAWMAGGTLSMTMTLDGYVVNT